MRVAQCVVLLLLVTVAFSHPARAQEDQATDRTDPVAVAQAYLAACDARDVEAAVALIAGEAVGQRFRTMIKYWLTDAEDEEDEVSWLTSEFVEMQFVPLGIHLKRETADTTIQDDTAHVAFKAAYQFDQNFVLKRQGDGTWAVDLIESVKATSGASETSLAEALMYFEQERESHVSTEARLWQLLEAMEQYAGDHEGSFPPPERWVDEIELYVLDRSLFRNPQQPDLEYGFAMNAEAGGRVMEEPEGWDEAEEPEDFVVLFEWPTGERNAVASLDEFSRLNADQQEGGMAYVTALGTTGRLPAGTTWAQQQEHEREEMAKMEDEHSMAATAYRCRQHLRVLGQAARKFAREHAGVLPGAETWQDDLALYLLETDAERWAPMAEPGVEDDDVFRCPAAPDLEYAYAINAEIAGKNALDLTDHYKIILFFECDLNLPNAAGVPERDAPEGGRHGVESLIEYEESETAAGGDAAKRGTQVVYLNGETGRLGVPGYAPFTDW